MELPFQVSNQNTAVGAGTPPLMKRGRTELPESEKADPCGFGDKWKNIGLDQNETSISSWRKLSKIHDWVLEVTACLCCIEPFMGYSLAPKGIPQLTQMV